MGAERGEWGYHKGISSDATGINTHKSALKYTASAQHTVGQTHHHLEVHTGLQEHVHSHAHMCLHNTPFFLSSSPVSWTLVDS